MSTWDLIRTAGIGAYLMLFLSVSWGLAATTAPFGKRVSKASAAQVHQTMSTVAMVLLGLHIAGVLADTYVPFSVPQVAVPMLSDYRPVAVAFGIVSTYAMVLVIVASWLRTRIGTSVWRRTHLLAVPAFTLALVHGLFAGSDGNRGWMFALYAVTGSIVLFLVLVRALTAGYRPPRADLPGRRSARPAAATVEAGAEA